LDKESTTKHTLNYFVPEDNETNDSAVHKQTGEQIKEPVNTEDNKPFSREEIAFVIKRERFILKRLLGRMHHLKKVLCTLTVETSEHIFFKHKGESVK